MKKMCIHCNGLGFIRTTNGYPILCPACGPGIEIKNYKCALCRDTGFIQIGCCSHQICTCKEDKNDD